MKRVFIAFYIVLAGLVSIEQATACSTFNLKKGDVNIFGRNYDWSFEDGAIIVNKRGLLKTASRIQDETGTPAKWKSKYGSITFNQYGREFPNGGINEAGLVVEMMAVPEGQHPKPDARPYVANGQYRQYLLDSFSTIKEVIESDSVIRVSRTSGPMTHLLLSDRTGASAIIEFNGGKRVIYTGESMPVRALTNTLYVDSASYWKAKNMPEEDRHRSVERFFLAADAVSVFDAAAVKAPIDHAFGILKKVSLGDRTKWSIVYDIKNRKIFLNTYSNPKIRTIDIKKMDFSCRTPLKMIDISTGSGDITNSFTDYTSQANRRVIGEAFKKTEFLKNVPAQALDARAAYPDSAKCEE